MLPDAEIFQRSSREQIAIHQARTPTERFLALCDHLDSVSALAPMDPESIERRRRAVAAHDRRRERDREQLRAFIRKWIAERGSGAQEGV